MKAIALILPCLAISQDWPAHRGANRDGVYSGAVRTSDWGSQGLKRLWKIKVGNGYAGVSIAGGKVFTVEQRGKQEAAVAYAIDTGKELWAATWAGDFNSFLGSDGPRSTPTFDSGRVYVQGAEGELQCLDAASGKTVWRKNVLQENGGKSAPYGVSISPLIVGNLLVTIAGGRAGSSVVAYRKDTGARVWGALDDPPAYASPMVAELDGKAQVIAVTAKRVAGLTIDEGKLLWEFPWSTNYAVNAAQPALAGPNRFLISSGYGHGAALVEVRGGKATAVWENKMLKNKFNSSVIWNGHIYGLDENILSCVDLATGQRKWKGGRYGYGQVALVQGGHLLITAESGEVALVKADPAQYQELGKFQALDGKTWNQPALGTGKLVVRNQKEMAAFDLLAQ